MSFLKYIENKRDPVKRKIRQKAQEFISER